MTKMAKTTFLNNDSVQNTIWSKCNKWSILLISKIDWGQKLFTPKIAKNSLNLMLYFYYNLITKNW